MDLLVPVIISGIFAFAGGYFFATWRLRQQHEKWVMLEAKTVARQDYIGSLERQIKERENQALELQRDFTELAQEKTAAEIKLEEALKYVDKQREDLRLLEEGMTNTFRALSGESLKSNNQAFLDLAQEKLDGLLSRAKGQIGEKEESIRTLVGSLDETLKKYEQQIQAYEVKRSEDYGSLGAQIQNLLAMNQQLQKETGNLVSALKKPEVRGRWGEITLRRVVELAGMVEHCDFQEQVSVTTAEGTIRPDMLVRLPGGRDIVVDSKVSLAAYLEAAAAGSDEEKKEHFGRHTLQVRQHMKSLAAKNYWDQFENAPEFVVMFIPGESFLSVALEADPGLLEEGMAVRVIIATPTTLIALLRAIAYGWRQEQLTQNAQRIANLGQELYERFAVFINYVKKTRNAMEQSTEHFNQMVGSMESRLMPSLRKFREFGISNKEELTSVEPIEKTPRQLIIPE